MENVLSKFKILSKEKKVAGIILGLLISYVLIDMVIYWIQIYRLNGKGVYYIARIYDIQSSKNGLHFYIVYNFKGKEYKDGFKPPFDFKPTKKDAYIYIKLLPDNPKINQYLEIGEVPTCLLNVTPPLGGWNKIPKCLGVQEIDSSNTK